MFQSDENTLKKLPPEVLAKIVISQRVRRLGEELADLRAELRREYGTIKQASEPDR